MEKDIYLDFGGWAKLDQNTRMQYIGSNENWDQIITARVWATLPEENRQFYVLEDFVAAMRDADDVEFNELNITDAEWAE